MASTQKKAEAGEAVSPTRPAAPGDAAAGGEVAQPAQEEPAGPVEAVEAKGFFFLWLTSAPSSGSDLAGSWG